jgi:release factor glutamine methyltransferase
VEWIEADLLAGVPDVHDAILANLPYVADCERGALAPEIARHEPAQALFAGADGLDAIRALCVQAAGRERLRVLALEHSGHQARTVRELLRNTGFTEVGSMCDLAGIERATLGKR